MAGIYGSDDNDQGYDGEQMRGQSHPGEAIDVLSRHGSQGGNDTERRIAGLVRTIEGEIIPRLMLAHAARGQALVSASGAPSSPIDPQHVDTLLRSVMAEDTASALQLVRSLAASGVSLEAIYLDLLSPAARKAGDLWEADRCSFTDVTIGLWRLQEVMHEVGMANAIPPRTAEPPHRVLLRAGRCTTIRPKQAPIRSPTSGAAGSTWSGFRCRAKGISTCSPPPSMRSARHRATGASASWSAVPCSSSIPTGLHAWAPIPLPMTDVRQCFRRTT
jgi:hypothetical protein